MAAHRSKFKNVFGTETKEKYLGLRINNKTLESPGLDASLEYIAFPWDTAGGGIVGVLHVKNLGNRSPKVVQFNGHKGTVQDISFSPFYDAIFATSSDDTTVKIWEVPQITDTESRQDAIATLTGHEKRVLRCTFNPVADWILATGSQDNTARIWNIETRSQAECIRLPSALQHVKWNYGGSLLAATAKDKMLRILDPRSSKHIVGEVICHEGPRGSKVEWLGGSISPDHLLFTAGTEKGPGREGALWDMRKLNSALQVVSLGRGAGSVFPYWDPDTGLMLLPGKGDGNIRVFEIYNQQIFVDAEVRSLEPARGFGLVPKRAVDVMKNEVLRCLKIDGPNSIQPIEFIVPRKSPEFQEDLFPPCFAGEPALTAAQWLDNQNAEPVRAPMTPTEDGRSPFKARRSTLTTTNTIAVASPAVLQKQLSRTTTRLKEQESCLSSQSNELDHLKTKLEALTVEFYAVTTEHKKLQEAHKALEEELERAVTQRQDAKSKLLEEQTKRQNVEKELAAAVQRSNDLEKRLTEAQFAHSGDANAQAQHDKLKAEYEKLRDDLNAMTARCKAAEAIQAAEAAHVSQQTSTLSDDSQRRLNELEDLFKVCKRVMLAKSGQGV